MLKYGNRELRSLEEQVERNAQDIEDFKNANQTIAEFGIYVVGILASVDDLPAQGENFGDAYLIGSQPPYDMHVWTRDVANNTAKWVDLGAFPLKGDKGDKGDTGSIIYADSGEPLNNPTDSFQFYLNTLTGYWYIPVPTETGWEWAKRFTLKGEKGDRGLQGKQGVQGVPGVQGKTGAIGAKGDKGDKGDTGAAFNVQGTLASSSNLPTPTAAMQDKGYAYIIPDAEGTKHIWVIQGSESTSFSWVDVGTAGVGIQGEKGADGIGLNTLTNTNLTLGDVTVTYDTTDGIGINSTMRQTYDGTNHDSTVDMNIPIVAGDGIAMSVMAGQQQVEIKIDQSKDIKLVSSSTKSVYFTSDSSASFGAAEGALYSSFGDESGIPRIRQKDPGGNRTYTFPTNAYGEHTILTSKNVKTVLGKSIVGTGNIGLYRHVIKITGGDVPYSECFAYLTIISSINLTVKSLADLKTLLGNTFEYPATGYDNFNLAQVYKVTQDGIIGTNNQGGSTSLSFANMTVFTDDVKTV